MSLVKNKYNIFKDSLPLIEIIFIIKVLILLKESFTWYMSPKIFSRTTAEK